MVDDDELPIGLTPRDYARVLRRWWWMLVGLPVLGALVGFAFTTAQPEVYEATVGIRFRSGQLAEADAVAAGKNAATVNREVETEVETIDAKYRGAVLQRLQLSDDDIESIRTRAIPDTNYIEITAATQGAQRSVEVAQAFGDIYVADVKRQEQDRAEARTAALGLRKATLENRLEEITTRIAAAAAQYDADNQGRVAAGLGPLPRSATLAALEDERDSLAQQYRQAEAQYAALQAAAIAAAPTTEIIARAELPEEPSSPEPVRAAAVGALLGLLAAIAATVVLEFIADRVRTRTDAERCSGLPVLAWIPRAQAVGSGPPVTLAAPQSPRADAFRALRTAVQFVRMRGPLDRIVVAGVERADGSESTAANLAVTLAATGASVLLVDGDLRHGDLPGRLGTPAAPGLTDVLLGQADLADAVHDLEVPGGVLGVLAAGTRPPNPADLLVLDAFGALLDRLTKEHEVVVIHAPAVLDAPDAISLALHSEGVVLVATARRTRRRHLGEAVTRLRRVGAHPIGVVLEGRGSDEAGSDPGLGELRPARRADG